MNYDFKVLMGLADSSGSGFYRMLEPARVAREVGVTVEIKDHIPIDGEHHLSELSPRVRDVITDADVIVLQRPLLQAFGDIIRIAHDKGIAVVIELDDDFENVHRDNMAWTSVQPEHNPNVNWKILKQHCMMADWVIVSTPALTRYAPHGRVSVLRNRVPASFLDTPRGLHADGPIRLGWTGTTQTHPNDLQVTGGMVWRALQESDAGFCVIGDGNGANALLGIPPEVAIPHTGWVKREEYVPYMALLLEVGIIPLEITKFNNAKSNLKGLEMASVGIPFVASPTEEYQLLASQGVGFLAKRPGDWLKRLRPLLTDASFREKRGAEAKEVIRRHYLYENAGEMWAAAWRKAIIRRREDT